jgi:hypothetical protein
VPGTEARRTLAVGGAALVPLAAGLVWLVETLLIAAVRGAHPNELWFGTMNDLHVWSILVALGPVACLGGALLGVLVGRWLHFRGAPPVVIVALVAVDILAQFGTMGEDIVENHASGDLDVRLRLWVPWALWHSGSVDGRSAVAGGNPFWYVLYLLALCALALGGAVWHDRTARTTRLRITLYAVIALAGCLFLLAVFTGPDAGLVSGLVPTP